MKTALLKTIIHEESVKYFDRVHRSDWKQFLYMGRNEEWYQFEETKDLDGIACPVLFIVGEGNKDYLENEVERLNREKDII
ncbi:hypothetical protein [Paenisporosarcina sp. TG-14]|uniref:hypothetical protein n=1 Tax=Paenisporosarcina sp. TG-14 TaxID=1231057 RepID=UPI0003058B34|nr:hypothetical protein [Paenisporosarcina sp. TG-14]